MSLWGDGGVALDSLAVEGVFGHLGERSSTSPGISRAEGFPAASRPSWELVLCWLSGVPGGAFLTSGAASRCVVDFSSVLSPLGDREFNRVSARMAGSCPGMSQFKVAFARFFPGVREALCLAWGASWKWGVAPGHWEKALLVSIPKPAGGFRPI